MMRPALDRPATDLVPCDETQTPDQKQTMMTTAVQTPLRARSGLKTYASVLATYASRLG